ncbi:poly-beta-1,6-N-acetyl-D-glucosamine biosynthesis protein PgaD [Sulfurirhabdus autotrophica]|uniref:Poly-beta-1,6-N-acetyl-D-glucosamine biosynthesis protein PgaD n=1 Tax=Sulfurirhabdus autotrophica TaxID=1706046 RepID=A0A4R3Y150_9PROT|nr:poly-beta-1,6-N-acetyl-D-glucosamine biosynthesis protein PgaD [Sulfurirhabdus autotrophica]TCV85152.1 poly-beta-1,6-N-acetyl-D-glucosamine biosynthesis protein PgaD [Sulfurirhabdus autotrophica]
MSFSSPKNKQEQFALQREQKPPAPFNVCQLIIEKPEKQKPGQKFLLGSITLLFWGAWSFLWAPVANTLGWAFGFYAFYEHLVVLRGWEGLVKQLPTYAVIAQIMCGGLILWAIINWRRFSGFDRRQPPQDVSLEDVAQWQSQPKEQIQKWQHARHIVVHYDTHGKLIEVETTPNSSSNAPLPEWQDRRSA